MTHRGMVRRRLGRKNISPDLRREWTRAVVEGGSSVAELARKAGYDPRTVSKHVEIGRGELLSEQVRVELLKEALRDHHAALCGWLTAVRARLVLPPESLSDLTASQDGASLRQHLPKERMWSLVKDWDRLAVAWSESWAAVEAAASAQLRKIGLASSEGLRTALLRHAGGLARTGEGLAYRGYKIGPLATGIRQWGSFQMEPEAGVISLSDEELLARCRAALSDFESDSAVERMISLREDALSLVGRLSSELEVLISRRFVAGSCDRCPRP